MNREFLKNLGIADDLIDKIMGEHGKDVQAEKDKAKTASGELETYKAKVSELEKAAEGNADLKKQLDDLKAQVEKEKKEAEAKAADEQMTALIKEAFPKDKKFVNEYTEQAMISQITGECADDLTLLVYKFALLNTTWSGTATKLDEALKGFASQTGIPYKVKGPARLSTELKKQITDLSNLGVSVNIKTTTPKGITLTYTGGEAE